MSGRAQFYYHDAISSPRGERPSSERTRSSRKINQSDRESRRVPKLPDRVVLIIGAVLIVIAVTIYFSNVAPSSRDLLVSVAATAGGTILVTEWVNARRQKQLLESYDLVRKDLQVIRKGFEEMVPGGFGTDLQPPSGEAALEELIHATAREYFHIEILQPEAMATVRGLIRKGYNAEQAIRKYRSELERLRYEE